MGRYLRPFAEATANSPAGCRIAFSRRYLAARFLESAVWCPLAVRSGACGIRNMVAIPATPQKSGTLGHPGRPYEVVAANILVVMAGIDPQTKLFTDPQTAIKKEIEAVRADKTIRNSEKKQMLEELNEALKSKQPIQFPTNIELVKKYYDNIDVMANAADGGDTSTNSSVVRTISE